MKNLKCQLRKNEIPHEGHGSTRFAASWSRLSGERNSLLLSQRFALHDLLDPQLGYPRDAEIEMFHFRARAVWRDSDPNRTELRLDNSYLFRIDSLSPYQAFLHNISWSARMGVERVTDLSCDECLSGIFAGGMGFTFLLDQQHRFLLSSLIDFEGSTSSDYDSRWKLAVGPNVRLRWILSPRFILQTGAVYHHLLWVKPADTFRTEAELRYSPRQNWSIGAKTANEARYWEHQLSLFYFY